MPGNTTAANVCAGRKQKNTKYTQAARKKTVEIGGKAPPTSPKLTSTPLALTTPRASAQVAPTSVLFALQFPSSMARAVAVEKDLRRATSGPRGLYNLPLLPKKKKKRRGERGVVMNDDDDITHHTSSS